MGFRSRLNDSPFPFMDVGRRRKASGSETDDPMAPAQQSQASISRRACHPSLQLTQGQCDSTTRVLCMQQAFLTVEKPAPRVRYLLSKKQPVNEPVPLLLGGEQLHSSPHQAGVALTYLAACVTGWRQKLLSVRR